MSEKLRRKDVNVYMTRGNLGIVIWHCSAIYNGHLETRLYFGYNKRDAVKIFIEEVTKQG